MTPVNVQEEVVHPPGVNNAAGNAPGLLTQIIWIGDGDRSRLAPGPRRRSPRAQGDGQSARRKLSGLAIVGIASCFTIWMASSWYGMELANAGRRGCSYGWLDRRSSCCNLPC